MINYDFAIAIMRCLGGDMKAQRQEFKKDPSPIPIKRSSQCYKQIAYNRTF